MARIEQLFQQPHDGVATGVDTGYQDLTSILQVTAFDLIIVAARPPWVKPLLWRTSAKTRRCCRIKPVLIF
ncbi:hypothetical protein KCP69_00900 [Salmonella enterica subsp. enterica]|nr:hypothetical protein KCP69_00900 [Salmonella enterica subsp. enterica]